ncbi:hypothetical protein fHeYen901_230 [Yersinia phage fHe-Yen9-01]|uniref:Lysis inhibition accessory protein n=1 Tax=Yersinia phage fHe-Yen9-01 TaxID=1965363 RepID=A0A1V0DXX5_9CAUD|nr:lysis inhibition; accessory protein [Yersinia phage fHe-Yen9-01]ARB06003.1 hypothetical protein fHeYen901_230 [Yersinia phage fHe-Yen9-01]
MNQQLTHALSVQRQAWSNGHENYGASIDVKAEALDILKGFKHLNPVQKQFADELEVQDELKFAKSLCSSSRKIVRHFIVTLK